MNKIKRLTWLVFAILCLTSCSESTIELLHVKRIVASGPENYTLWYSDSANSQDLKTYEPKCICDFQIVMDASPEKDIWATIYRHAIWCFGEYRITLHIHSAEEIN